MKITETPEHKKGVAQLTALEVLVYLCTNKEWTYARVVGIHTYHLVHNQKLPVF